MTDKNFILVLALQLLLLNQPVKADDVKPDNEVSFNAGFTTDYRYRGISQSAFDPAVQGGADLSNTATGLYVGTWLSSIKWINDAGGDDALEWDIYAGQKGKIAEDLSYDLGILRYVYPSNKLAQVPTYANADTTELYGQLSYKVLNLKYSQSTTNIFAFPDSEKSTYLDFWTSIDIAEGYALGLHAGHQKVENSGAWSYSDWKIGIAKDFFDVSWTLGVVGTNASKALYVTPDGRFTGRTSLILSASKSF